MIIFCSLKFLPISFLKTKQISKKFKKPNRLKVIKLYTFSINSYLNLNLLLQKLVPSGSTFLSRQTMTSTTSRFAYAGDSHVYIYDMNTYRLEKILPFCEVSVTHIMFHPTNPNMIGCLSMDNSFELWDIERERCMIKVEMEKTVKQIDWNFNDTNLISFVIQ